MARGAPGRGAHPAARPGCPTASVRSRVGAGAEPDPAGPGLGPFPEKSSLRYTPWYRVMLQETNRDACQVTELFRRFMAKHNIPADDPHLEKNFGTYCWKLPRA